jgi:hypothetical protein
MLAALLVVGQRVEVVEFEPLTSGYVNAKWQL